MHHVTSSKIILVVLSFEAVELIPADITYFGTQVTAFRILEAKP